MSSPYLPLDEIEARTKKLKEIADRQKSLVPFETKVIPISYGKIDEIANKVKDFSTPSSDVSKGGKIIIHSESNTFVVIDTPAVIKKMEALVRYLDKPPKQVMVEAKIVEVGESFARNFGLKWDIGNYISVKINARGIVGIISKYQRFLCWQFGRDSQFKSQRPAHYRGILAPV